MTNVQLAVSGDGEEFARIDKDISYLSKRS